MPSHFVRFGYRPGLAVTAALAASVAWSEPLEVVEGNVRVQFLSPTLLRIEEKGPSGFENRPTFHVVERKWSGADYKVEVRGQIRRIQVSDWTLLLPLGASSISQIQIVDNRGKALWQDSSAITNSVLLPSPGTKPNVWSFADNPRLARTAAPMPEHRNPVENWDRGNDARDVYVFLPKGSYNQLRTDFLRLTGPTEMPPLYALGYIHSRYHEYTQQSVKDLTEKYLSEQIYPSIFVIDTNWRIGASHGYGEEKKLFPDFEELFGWFKEKGIHTMFNDHPEPQAKDAFSSTELDYRWKGLSGWINRGLDAWWYDRNWYIGLVEPLPGLRKEVWGMYLYRDMTLSARPGVRPLIMANIDGIDNGRWNRPPNVAAHRYPIQWTGDTSSTFEFLKFGVENAVRQGVEAVYPYVSEDLGGHIGNPPAEQYLRWMEYGALSPTMRLHYTMGAKDREPWAYGPEVTATVRDYVHLRYSLLPTLYALCRENFETGSPLLARLDLKWPQHKQAAANNQYLLGDTLLVAPITSGNDPKPVPAAQLSEIKGAFFAGDDLKGDPIATATAKDIAFRWGQEAPVKGVPVDHFSDRWTLNYAVLAEAQDLFVKSDDGIRVYVDGKLVVDEWKPLDSPLIPIKFDFQPNTKYALTIEHQELDGNSRLELLARSKNADPSEQRSVWVPPGIWRDLWTGTEFKGPKTIQTKARREQIPLYAQVPGAVVRVPVSDRPIDAPWKDVILDVFAGKDGKASATLYEDDRTSTKYASEYRKTRFDVEISGKSISISPTAAGPGFPGALKSRRLTVRLHLPAKSKVPQDFDLEPAGNGLPFLVAKDFEVVAHRVFRFNAVQPDPIQIELP
ncbi:MAG: DUF5110 domain-containing protein [Armatimonadetes bacterium]|nr:DUF5110 domain-containing protein [Armatimonadota bacterium]